MINKKKNIFNLFVNYFKIYKHLSKLRKFQLVMLSLLTVVLTFTELLSLASIIPLINIFTNSNSLVNNQFIEIILSITNLLNPDNPLNTIVIIFIVIVILSGALKILELTLSINFSARVEADIKEKIFKIFINKPYELQINKNTNEIMSMLTQKTNNAASAIHALTTVFSSVITSVFILIFLLTIHTKLIAILFLTITIFFIIVFLSKNKNVYERGQKISLLQNEIVESFDNASGYAKEIKINKLQQFFISKFSINTKAFAKNTAKIFIIGNSPRIYLEYFSIILLILILYFLSHEKQNVENLSLLAVIALGSQKLLPLINKIYNSFVNLKANEPIILDIFDYMNNNQITNNIYDEKKNKFNFIREIKFSNVSFSYFNSRNPQIKNLSFLIKKGNNIGIKGKTGSGKSTLGNLIIGLLKPSEGEILVDKNNITVQNLKAWQSNISIVPQKVFLHDASIYENIALGLKKENIDIEKVKIISQIVLLNKFIENLPLKYDEKVGKDGIKLSGGQIKRIAIARALYRNTEVVLFDETTNELDENTESTILLNLNKFYKDKTFIFISHRSSVHNYCEEIIDLDKNNVQNN